MDALFACIGTGDLDLPWPKSLAFLLTVLPQQPSAAGEHRGTMMGGLARRPHFLPHTTGLPKSLLD